MKKSKGFLIPVFLICILFISIIGGSVYAADGDLFAERTLYVDDFKCIKNENSEYADIKFNIISSYQTSAEVLVCLENNDMIEIVYHDKLDIDYKSVYSKRLKVEGYDTVKIVLFDSFSGLHPISYKREFKIDEISSGREIISLNGVWEFMPAENSAKNLPTDISAGSWGTVLVPGVWANNEWFNDNYGVAGVGVGDMWDGSYITYERWRNILKNVSRCWYKKTVDIPSYWEGNKTIITLNEVATDAVVYVNGNYCGELNWEDTDRDIDVTDYIVGGTENTIIVKVVAADNIDQFGQFNNPNYTISTHSNVPNKGIMGDVLLTNMNADLIDGTYIKTSVKNQKIDIDVMVNENLFDATVTAEIFNKMGEKVKAFSNTLNSSNKKLTLSSVWEDPILWDTDNPHMYTAHITVECDGKVDDYTEKFGFREFEIRGRDFYLNNTRIRLRPITQQNGYNNLESTYNEIDGLKKANFNIIEIWPSDRLSRGQFNGRDLYAEIADELGMLLIYPISSVNPFVINTESWNITTADVDWVAYDAQVKSEWQMVCNHPSIVSFITQPNHFGTGDDENPYKLGNRTRLIEDIRKTGGDSKVQFANNLINSIKKYEKTRPVTTHHGSAAGDWHTSNFYLNFIPIQERKEWFTEWLKDGDIPFTAIEFGMPFEDTFTRQRQAGGRGDSEPFYTEYPAAYIGARAYELEKTTNGIEYNNEIRNRYVGGMSFDNLQKDKLFNNPAVQELISLYAKETWKSYRAQEIGGGFMPWSFGGGLVAYTGMYQLPQFATIDNPYPYYEGQRGIYNYKTGKGFLLGAINDSTAERPVLTQLKESNAPFVAYVMGNEENISEVSHNFYEGTEVEKQLVVINDTRHKKNYTATIKAYLGGGEVYSQNVSGTVETGENDYKPIRFTLPMVDSKTSGSINIVVNVDGEQYTDEFEITVFDTIPTQNKTVYMCDPSTETKTAYEALGYTVVPYTAGQSLSGQIVIIGKNALETNPEVMNDINNLTNNGCKIIIHGQSKDWLETNSDYRIANVVSRQVFKVASQVNHPVLAGIDDKDLANWNGRGSIAPEEINTELENTNWSRDGYHWKNTGSVTSVPIEKPHYSGFTPILECEYDLAYSPLMELDKGSGKVILCTLDIENRGAVEPAVDLILKNLVDYCGSAQVVNRRDVIIIGGTAADTTLLNDMKVSYTIGSASNSYTDKLIIFGRNYTPKTNEINKLNNGSNKLLFLGNGYNVGTSNIQNFTGSINIPTSDLFKGVSASDTHIRVGLNTKLFTGSKALLDGMVAVDGNITMVSVLPDSFDTNSYFYYRTSKWRNQRLLSQIISNLGGSFGNDSKIFNGSVYVDLSQYFNMDGIATADNPRDGNFDGLGYSYAGELLPDSVISNNIKFNLGSKKTGENNMIKSANQEIAINANAGRMSMLAVAGNASQGAVNIIVKYTDGSTETTTINPAGWGGYSDSIAIEAPYRYTPYGTIHNFYVRIFQYEINVTPDKKVASVVLPGNDQLKVVAMSYKELMSNCYSKDYITEHENGDDPYRYHRW